MKEYDRPNPGGAGNLPQLKFNNNIVLPACLTDDSASLNQTIILGGPRFAKLFL